MTSDPNRDFADQAKRTMDRMVEEANELDYALRQGRIADLIKKYNPRHAQQADEAEEEDDRDDTGTNDGRSDPDVEGEAG